MGTLSSVSRQLVATDEPEVSELAGLLPRDFLFGAATSAYQVEGAVHAGGRGESIWDRFSSSPGKTFDGHTGAGACDHYHLFGEDIGLMASLGLTAYRFSIAWPRIIPDGAGSVNVEGLDFYDRLVDELLAHGIQPFATLYHWDLPQALQERGGWYSRDTAGAFEAYAEAVVRRLGDRIGHWITLNEPWVQAWHGHGEGVHAPGLTDGPVGAIKAGHHLLLAHGTAVRVLRGLAPNSAIGITLDFAPAYPRSDSLADRQAAELMDVHRNRWFVDPVIRGAYPTGDPAFTALLPDGFDTDLELIGAPIDFLGVNYYSRAVVSADPVSARPVWGHLPQVERTDAGWEIFPDGLHSLLVRLSEYTGVDLYVTENGAAYADRPQASGSVPDSRRTRYLASHLRAAACAIADGVDLKGYFVWSLLDNFEWARGYDDNTRFGVVYVDFDTQRRYVKDSAKWYSALIAAHGSRG